MTFTEAQFNKFKEDDRKSRVLEGTAYWSWIQKPKHSEKYKNDEYTINLVLDAAGIAKAQSFGLVVKDADKHNPGSYVTISRKVRPGKTIEETKPQVVDAMQKPVADTIMIGNGSTVLCKFATYYFGDKVRTALLKVQIRNLIRFENKSEQGLVMDSSGFQADAAAPLMTADGFDA